VTTNAKDYSPLTYVLIPELGGGRRVGHDGSNVWVGDLNRSERGGKMKSQVFRLSPETGKVRTVSPLTRWGLDLLLKNEEGGGWGIGSRWRCRRYKRKREAQAPCIKNILSGGRGTRSNFEGRGGWVGSRSREKRGGSTRGNLPQIPKRASYRTMARRARAEQLLILQKLCVLKPK